MKETKTVKTQLLELATDVIRLLDKEQLNWLEISSLANDISHICFRERVIQLADPSPCEVERLRKRITLSDRDKEWLQELIDFKEKEFRKSGEFIKP